MKSFNTNPYANPQVKRDELDNLFKLARSFHITLKLRKIFELASFSCILIRLNIRTGRFFPICLLPICPSFRNLIQHYFSLHQRACWKKRYRETCCTKCQTDVCNLMAIGGNHCCNTKGFHPLSGTHFLCNVLEFLFTMRVFLSLKLCCVSPCCGFRNLMQHYFLSHQRASWKKMIQRDKHTMSNRHLQSDGY